MTINEIALQGEVERNGLAIVSMLDQATITWVAKAHHWWRDSRDDGTI